MKLDIEYIEIPCESEERSRGEILSILKQAGIAPVTADDINDIIFGTDGSISYCDRYGDDTLLGYTAYIDFAWSDGCGLHTGAGDLQFCGKTYYYEQYVEARYREETADEYGEDIKNDDDYDEEKMMLEMFDVTRGDDMICDANDDLQGDEDVVEECERIAWMFNAGIAEEVEREKRWHLEATKAAPETYVDALKNIKWLLDDMTRLHKVLNSEVWKRCKRKDDGEVDWDDLTMGETAELFRAERGIDITISQISQEIERIEGREYEEYVRIGSAKVAEEMTKEAAKKGVKS